MALPGMAPAAEWPGAISGKFTDKIHGRSSGVKVTHSSAAHGDSSCLAQQGFGNYFTDTRGLGPESCRRYIDVAGSDEHRWKPSRRSLSQPGQDHLERPEGIRKLPQPKGRLYSMPEKRHIRQVGAREEHGDIPVGQNIVHRANGLRAADQPAREVDLSFEMQRKVRNRDLLDQRNGIGVKALGDKYYRHPEYDRRFYHDGGLVPGSSFARGTHPKHQSRNSGSVNLVLNKDSKPFVSFKDKAAQLERTELREEVRKLTSHFEKVKLREELTDMKKELEEAKAGGKVPDVGYHGGSGLEQMKTYVSEYLDALDDSDEE